jgi:hypothetical protein
MYSNSQLWFRKKYFVGKILDFSYKYSNFPYNFSKHFQKFPSNFLSSGQKIFPVFLIREFDVRCANAQLWFRKKDFVVKILDFPYKYSNFPYNFSKNF